MDTMRETPSMSDNGSAADEPVDVRRALLVGLVGGVVAAAGYLLYQRLDEGQKETIKHTVVSFVQDKISEVRGQLKV